MYSVPESEEEVMKMPESKFKLGDRVKGKFTGATGIVIGITFYMHGPIVYAVQPIQTVNGSPVSTFQCNEFYMENDEECQN